jgi:hypothetical protein
MKTLGWFVTVGLLLSPAAVIGGPTEFVGSEQWQQRRLLEPTPAEVAGEQSGRVFIYDGVRDATVDRAMDEEFDRIQSMMFIRTKQSNPDGEVVDYDDDC